MAQDRNIVFIKVKLQSHASIVPKWQPIVKALCYTDRQLLLEHTCTMMLKLHLFDLL